MTRTAVPIPAAVLLAALLAATIAALSGCGAGLPDDVAGRDYVNREFRFAMDVPDGWRVRESRGVVSVFAVDPAGGAGEANVTVAVEPAHDIQTLAALAEYQDRQTDRLRGIERLGSGERTLAGGLHAATATFQHQDAGTPVRQEQVYLLAGGRAYTITATAAPPQAFDAHADAFEIVFRSFRAAW
jgi:hypothetical protein